MRNIVVFLIVFLSLSAAVLQAQGIPSVSRDQFEAAVHASLTSHDGGEYFYAHSDSYRKLVNFSVRKQLGLIHERNGVLPQIAVGGDISQTFDASNSSNDEDETSVAINRINTSTICIGANEDGNDGGMYTFGMPVYTSTDKGSSWKTYRLPQPVGTSMIASGDPIVIADDQGNFFYSYLGGDGNTYDIKDIAIARSQDGIEWSNATAININTNTSGSPDKEHMCVDNSPESPHHGRVYVVWYEFYSTNVQQGEGLNVVWRMWKRR